MGWGAVGTGSLTEVRKKAGCPRSHKRGRRPSFLSYWSSCSVAAQVYHPESCTAGPGGRKPQGSPEGPTIGPSDGRIPLVAGSRSPLGFEGLRMRILDLWKAVIGGKAGHPKKAPAEGVGVDLPSKAGASDPYFELMGRLQVAYSNGDFEAARQVVQATLPQLRKFVKRWTAEYGTFDIASIPVLETGGRVLAILEDRETLELMAKEVRQLATLYPWRDTIEGHLADVEVVHRIRGAVGEQPGLLQNRLKFHLGLDDGRHLALIVGLLDKCGRLCRTRVKKTYALTLPGQPLPVDLQDAVGGTAGRSTALPSSSRSSSVVQSSLSPGHGKGRRTLQPARFPLKICRTYLFQERRLAGRRRGPLAGRRRRRTF